MFYIRKINDYLKIVTDKEVMNFVAINFREYFKSIREKQNLRKVSKSLYLFLTTSDEVEKCVQSNSSDNRVHHYNVEILNLFDPELQLINTKPVVKNILKELLSELKKFNVQAVLEYKKRNDRKVFHSSAKLIASDSHIDEAFRSMHQNIMTKVENYACKDWIPLYVIIKQSIKIFEW